MAKPSGLNKYEKDILQKASRELQETDVEKYLNLKRLFKEILLNQSDKQTKDEFRKYFINYYRLNAGGLTEEFKEEFFKILFNESQMEKKEDPYTPILRQLYKFRRRKGDQALYGSFVSKLVAMHDDTSPIFDKYVNDFFGISAPSSEYNIDFRIERFVTNIKRLRTIYAQWSSDADFKEILQCVRKKHPGLSDCADSRIADLLVWTAGKGQIGKKVSPNKD